MSDELKIHVTVSPALIEWAAVAALLAAFPAMVGSETVTLQTYYPAPYGIYSQMRTVETTTLAEKLLPDNLTAKYKVGIGLGTGVAPSYLLDIKGGNTTVNATGVRIKAKVGIGSTDATSMPDGDYYLGKSYLQNKLQLVVDGNVAVGKHLFVGGNSQCSQRVASTNSANAACTGYSTYAPGLYVDGNWYTYYPYTDKKYYYVSTVPSPDATNPATWEQFPDPGVIWYCCTFN